MSREALSLDISRLVSRVVSGEPIDTAERGAALAAKYPDLGMSGAMIGQAIERAAGMVGMIRDAPEVPRPSPVAAEAPSAGRSMLGNGHQPRAASAAPAVPSASVAPMALPVAALSIDDELAAAIDAEIGSLVSGKGAPPVAPSKPNGERHPPASDAAQAGAASEPANGSIFSRGPVAAFRRALFRT